MMASGSRFFCKSSFCQSRGHAIDISFRSLATYLIRHADLSGVDFKEGAQSAVESTVNHLLRREETGHAVGRLGGGVGKAMEEWLVEGWLYIILMSIAIGAVIGFGSMFAIKFALRKKWIDSESFLLWPMATGVSICTR